MPSWLVSIPAFIVAIGLLVAVHEFGHFWVARRLGVKVLRYSIGFGQKVWGRTSSKTGTEYWLSAIPLGGYVKMLDEREGPVAESEQAFAFNRQALWKRSAIVAAGPGINFLFAILAYWLVFMLGVSGIKSVIAEVPENTQAYSAGLEVGDQIVSVDGQATPTWTDLRLALLEQALNQKEVTLSVRDDDGDLRTTALDFSTASADPELLFQSLGLQPYRPRGTPIISDVVPGQPAAAADLQAGDRVLSVNGDEIAGPQGLVDWVQAHPGVRAEFVVERGGERQSILVDLAALQQDGERIGRLGAHIGVDASEWEALRTQRRLGPIDAMPAAVAKSWSVSALTVRLLWRMVVGDVSWRNISGPIQIADYAGKTASIGLEPFLSFLALISISLAIINLLPVPVLDGGHLLYYGFEFIRGKPLSDEAQMMGQQVGMAALFMLMGLAFYNDILRLLG